MPLLADSQFNRGALVVVGSRDVSELRVSFNVKRALTRGPNTAEIKVYNAKPDTRAEWSAQKRPPLRLDVGYGGRLATIFLGAARFIEHYREGQSIVTEITGGDGEDAVRASLVYKALGPKVPAHEILREAATAVGVDPGNLESAVRALEARGLASLFSEGGMLSGSAADQLTRVCNSYGLEWSIQDGALQILERDKPVNTRSVFEYSKTSGLLGSPRLNQKGELSFSALLNPVLKPGLVVSMKSEFVQGGFRLTDVDQQGDTQGGEWKSDCHGRRY